MSDLSRAMGIPGYMHPSELRWLAERAQRAQTIIEIGCLRGRSTRALADHCAGIVYAIDPWGGPYFNDNGTVNKIKTNVFDEFAANLADHIASGRVVAVRQAFTDALPAMQRDFSGRIDLAFIDGDHRYESVRQDIIGAMTLVRPGGLLAGHDYTHPSWPGVKRAVDDLLGDVQRCKSIWWVTI